MQNFVFRITEHHIINTSVTTCFCSYGCNVSWSGKIHLTKRWLLWIPISFTKIAMTSYEEKYCSPSIDHQTSNISIVLSYLPFPKIKDSTRSSKLITVFRDVRSTTTKPMLWFWSTIVYRPNNGTNDLFVSARTNVELSAYSTS